MPVCENVQTLPLEKQEMVCRFNETLQTLL
jgi:hypothetical protein